MDLIGALQVANTAFDQVKQAAASGQEVYGVMQQLVNWASSVGDVNKTIAHEQIRQTATIDPRNPQPPTDTQRAMQIYMARVRTQEMEREIYHMFHYGALCHLGRDGYNELMGIREHIRKQKDEELVQERAREIEKEADSDFMKQAQIVVGGMTATAAGIIQFWDTIKVLFE